MARASQLAFGGAGAAAPGGFSLAGGEAAAPSGWARQAGGQRQGGEFSPGRLRRLFAFGISLTAHLAIAMGLGFHAGLYDGPVLNQGGSPRVLAVYLEKPANPKAIPATPAAGSDDPKEPSARLPVNRARPIPQADDSRPPLPLIGLTEPHYFRIRELTKKPRVLNDVSPHLGAAFAGVPPQTAVLRLLINERGNIDRVVIERSFLPEHLAEVVTDAFSKLKFEAGQIDNLLVKSELRIEVNLESTLTD